MSKQLLRSGTSIGANLAEAKYAQSDMDFIHKYSISQKEASETIYWIDILHEGGFLDDAGYESIYADATEIIKLITSIILTSKKKQQNN